MRGRQRGVGLLRTRRDLAWMQEAQVESAQALDALDDERPVKARLVSRHPCARCGRGAGGSEGRSRLSSEASATKGGEVGRRRAADYRKGGKERRAVSVQRSSEAGASGNPDGLAQALSFLHAAIQTAHVRRATSRAEHVGAAHQGVAGRGRSRGWPSLSANADRRESARAPSRGAVGRWSSSQLKQKGPCGSLNASLTLERASDRRNGRREGGGGR